MAGRHRVRRVPINVPVSGLDHVLGPVADGHLVTLEGSGDAAASYLAASLARDASEQGRSVDTATTRRRTHPEGTLAASWDDVPLEPEGDLVVDSLSVLAVQADPARLSRDLMRLSCHLERTSGIGILVLEAGLLDPVRAGIIRHFSDGMLSFVVQTEGVDVQRMLRVPRWLDGAGRDTGIYYQFDGRRLVVDMRRRHV